MWCPERSDLDSFYFEDVVLQKGLIDYNFYFEGMWWSFLYGLICVILLSLERTYFGQFLLWDDVEVLLGLMILQVLLGRIWWS